VYDALNRRTETIVPWIAPPHGPLLVSLTTFAYDAVGNLAAVLDADGNHTTFAYDALDRKVRETDPLGATATFAYDAVGRLTSAADRVGQRRDRSYDHDGRLTGEIWFNAVGSTDNLLTYTYDPAGNLLSAADVHGAYTLTYDALNRVTSAAEPFNLTLTFTYDANGNRIGIADSRGGLVTSVYDAADRLVERDRSGGISAAPQTVTLTWTARNQPASISRSSGPSPLFLVGTADYAYDPAGRLTGLQQRDGSGTLVASYSYSYDAAGQLLLEAHNGTSVTYAYDPSGQLVGDSAADYSYDANGNRGNPVGGWSNVGPGNRLLTDGDGWQYGYDGNGNVVSKARGSLAWSYGYDERNQLRWAEQRLSGAVVARVD